MCNDRTPVAGCTLMLSYRDSSGEIASRTVVTGPGGEFKDTLTCPFSNQVGEHFVVTAKCCKQSWTVSSSSCSGDLGTFVCDNCGGAGCAEPPDGLVAWWPLDEESGPQSAEVVGHNHGTQLGGPAPVGGTVGNALSFDGVDDEVQATDDPALDFGAQRDFSIDFWLRTAHANGTVSLLEKRENQKDPRGYAVFLSEGTLFLQLAEGGSLFCDSTTGSGCTNYDSGVAVADGQWHFIAITVDRDATDGIRWYVDGVEVGKRGNPILRGDSLANAAPLHIGAHAFTGPSFKGTLDEIELINRVLPPEKIAALHEAGLNGKCRDKLNSQWDVSMCPNAATVKAKPLVCNFSSAEQSYDLAFTPATADDDPKCEIDGPAGFTILPPTTLPLLVPPQSCRTVDLEIARPDVPAGTTGVACYHNSIRNIESGAVVDEIGELSLVQLCGRFGLGPSDLLVGFDRRFEFDLINSGDLLVALLYQFEVMPSSMNPEDVIVLLSPPGPKLGESAATADNIVTGSVEIPAGGTRTVSVNARLLAFEPLNIQNILLRNRSNGAVLASAGLRAFSPGCTPGPTTLCLNGGRFEVHASWRDFAGNTGLGKAVPLTGSTGYFWFFNPANVELVLKVLDGRGLNDQFWVFYGALSTVEYVVTVTDTETGTTKTFANPSGHLASVADTNALPGSSRAAFGAELAVVMPTVKPAGACAPSSTALCLNGGRFRAEATWRDFQGNTGAGQAVPLTSDTGYFWFFSPENVELAMKVLDGTPLNQHWWFLYGALSNVEYRITVTDTATGSARTYFSPSGNIGSVADTSAFPE